MFACLNTTYFNYSDLNQVDLGKANEDYVVYTIIINLTQLNLIQDPMILLMNLTTFA